MYFMYEVNINWVSSHRYLGVFLESSFNFKSSYSANKASFYEAFNAIFGKVGRSASEEVLFALLKSKCLPILLYGTEACPTVLRILQSDSRSNLPLAESCVRYSARCLVIRLLWFVISSV